MRRGKILVFDRVTRHLDEEKIYGGFFLKILYKNRFFAWLLPLLSRSPAMSHFYGWLQSRSFTKRKIEPFIKKFSIDRSEFAQEVTQFSSFNDFFIRKLKADARPIERGEGSAIMPADGRYLAYPNIEKIPHIWAKNQSLSLNQLFNGNQKWVDQYAYGSLLIARLAPVDYHRFHFPSDCLPTEPLLLNGPLYSVNPIALTKNINYLTENKRVITFLDSEDFGKIAYIEVGATHVGSIHQTYSPNTPYEKGDEKGYFSFGGSTLLLLFEPNRIIFAQDLLDHTAQGHETRALMGQLMGVKT